MVCLWRRCGLHRGRRPKAFNEEIVMGEGWWCGLHYGNLMAAAMRRAATPACACAARTGQSRHGLFVDGNRTVEAIVSGPLIAHDFPTLIGAAYRRRGTRTGARPARRSADC